MKTILVYQSNNNYIAVCPSANINDRIESNGNTSDIAYNNCREQIIGRVKRVDLPISETFLIAQNIYHDREQRECVYRIAREIISNNMNDIPRVVVEANPETITIITVYKTSQIERYLQKN